VKNITVRLEDKTHKALKFKLLEEDRTIQEALTKLIGLYLNGSVQLNEIEEKREEERQGKPARKKEGQKGSQPRSSTNSEEKEDYLSAKQAAEILGVSKRTVLRRIDRGEITAEEDYSSGRKQYLILREELDGEK